MAICSSQVDCACSTSNVTCKTGSDLDTQIFCRSFRHDKCKDAYQITVVSQRTVQ